MRRKEERIKQGQTNKHALLAAIAMKNIPISFFSKQLRVRSGNLLLILLAILQVTVNQIVMEELRRVIEASDVRQCNHRYRDTHHIIPYLHSH